MNYHFLIGIGLCMVWNTSIFMAAAPTSPTYASECFVWDQLDQSLEAEDNMEITCSKNPLCTGIDCTGKYTYTGLITAFQKFTVGLCTGLALLPCSHPLALYVYTEMPSQNVNFSRTFTRSQLVQIDGASFDAQPFGKADSFLDVDMNTTEMFGKKYVSLGIKMKIRLTLASGMMQQWPEGMQVTVVPDTLIPVPVCQPSIHVSPHPLANCDPDAVFPDVKKTTPLPTGKSYPPTKQSPGGTTRPTAGPHGPCKVGEMGSCKNHQICKASPGSSQGVCQCTSGSVYHSDTKECVLLHTDHPPTIPIIYAASTPAPGSSKVLSKNTIIIIGCSLGGVAVLVALVTVVLVKYKRYRSQYANHVLLLATQDNDAEDEET